jgi:cell filamentation protein
MNGQCLVQTEQSGRWATDKVEKAGAVKPGIYNIHLALDADKSGTYDGLILHSDREHIFQQIGKSSFVKHALADFDKVPEIGSNSSIRYVEGTAVTSHLASTHRLKHGIA